MTACALCSEPAGLARVDLPPGDDAVLLCPVCAAAVLGDVAAGPRWRCLADAIWSEDPATQIAAYRVLSALPDEAWAADLLETVYLADDVLARARAGLAPSATLVEHRDSNGALLMAGDTVTLIKDLPVKGSSMVAKRGTAVRGIRLVADNPDQIEGRVNGQQIVILCQYVKRSA